MRKLTALAGVLALLLFVAACGSSASDGSESEADKAPTTDAATDETSDDGPSTTLDPTVAELTAEDYAAAFVTRLSSGDPELDLVLTPEQASCVAPKWVDAVGLDTLKAGGVTVEEASKTNYYPDDLGLDEAVGGEMLAAMQDCDVDMYALIAAFLSGGMTDEQQACIATSIDHDLADALMRKRFAGVNQDAELQALLDDLNDACDLPPD